jgi:hypothetical protein
MWICGHGDNFIHIHDTFKRNHGYGYGSSAPEREANSHPGENAKHGTNASK